MEWAHMQKMLPAKKLCFFFFQETEKGDAVQTAAMSPAPLHWQSPWVPPDDRGGTYNRNTFYVYMRGDEHT